MNLRYVPEFFKKKTLSSVLLPVFIKSIYHLHMMVIWRGKGYFYLNCYEKPETQIQQMHQDTEVISYFLDDSIFWYTGNQLL